MNYTEQPILFACGQDTLAGILAAPETSASIGVVVVVGGPQYRVGSHRQFVLLARALAQAGYPVLRFDHRGMGDSTGAQRDFTTLVADVSAAIDTLQARLPSVKQVALWGLCDGASAALLYWHETQDVRVTGLCLLNPWVRSEASLARAHVKHYYTRRLAQKEFWVKLLRGKVAVAAFAGLWHNVRTMGATSASSGSLKQIPFQQRMAGAVANFNGSILLLLSGDDYTAKEFLEFANMDAAWSGLLTRPHIVRRDLPDADHTFSNAAARAQVETLTLGWLQSGTPR